MYCPNCGNKIEENKSFCTACGCKLKNKKSIIVSTIITVILSILTCQLTFLVDSYGIKWLYLYSYLIIPIFLFTIIISYGNFYRSKLKSKSIIASIAVAFILSVLYYCLINLIYQTFNYPFSIIAEFLIIPNIILSTLVALKRKEVKVFIMNNIQSWR